MARAFHLFQDGAADGGSPDGGNRRVAGHSRLKRIHFLFSFLFWRSKDVLFFFFFLKYFEILPPEKKGYNNKVTGKYIHQKTLQFFEHELTCEVMNCPFCGGKMENCRHRYEGIPRKAFTWVDAKLRANEIWKPKTMRAILLMSETY